MAIDRIDGPGGFDRPGKLGDARGSAGKAEDSRSGAGDRVDLSPEAKQVAALADRARALPEIRQELVDAIRSSLNDGTYEADSRRVAEAMLEFEDGFRD